MRPAQILPHPTLTCQKRIKTKQSSYSILVHILCRGEYFQILDNAGNTVYQQSYYTQLSDELIQVPSGGKVTIQVKLQSYRSIVSGHFAVLNKSIDSGEDLVCHLKKLSIEKKLV